MYNIKMAHMKQCRKCNEVKELSQFSKCSVRKDGLQYNCKSCNKKDNLKFRTEINPSHHQIWQRNNLSRLCQLVQKYRKADKNSIIYSITNPAGETYIGMTQMYLKVRKWEHIAAYRNNKPNAIPLLRESFEKYGVDNHKFELVVDMGDIDREQLKFIESSFIQAFQQTGKSLNIKK